MQDQDIDTRKFRRLGKSDLTVSTIIFGAWAIGGWMWGGLGRDGQKDAIDAIHAAVDGGATSIDTAAVYGYGLSEEIVGRAIAQIKGGRDKVQILTKYGLRWDASEGEHFFDWTEEGHTKNIFRNARKKSIILECENSLRRLKTDYIDLYQCHWRDHTTPLSETMEAMVQLIEQGKIRAAGVSNFTAEYIAQCEQICPIASNQPPFSMIYRKIEQDVLPYCREHDIATIVYSPLQRGLLTGKFKPDHVFADGDHRANQKEFQPQNISRINDFLQKIKPIADGHGATLGQLVIAWTIARPGITAALVGARDAAQTEQNLKAQDLILSDDEIAQIDRHLTSLQLITA